MRAPSQQTEPFHPYGGAAFGSQYDSAVRVEGRPTTSDGACRHAFQAWRWFAAWRVAEICTRTGWSIAELVEARTGTLYLRLKRRGRPGLRVRVADHGAADRGPREFFVLLRHKAGREGDLGRWLASWSS